MCELMPKLQKYGLFLFEFFFFAEGEAGLYYWSQDVIEGMQRQGRNHFV